MNNLKIDQYIDAILKETGLKLVDLEQGTTTKNHIMAVVAMRQAYKIIKDLLSICGEENHKWDGTSSCPCMIRDCSKRTALLFPSNE